MVKKELELRTQIYRLVEEAIEDRDVFLVDVVVRGRQGSRVVEVFIDADHGVGVDSLAKISRQLAFVLDSEDLIRGKYHLNVSSPGAEKALKLPRQYRQHEGRKIEITIRSENPEGGSIVETGELVSSSAEDVVLRLGSGKQHKILFEEIDEAHIVMPW